MFVSSRHHRAMQNASADTCHKYWTCRFSTLLNFDQYDRGTYRL